MTDFQEDTRLVLADVKQFMKLLPYGLDDHEMGHRMVKTPSEVRTFRRLFGNAQKPLSETSLNYRTRLVLGEWGISTIGQLYSKTEKEIQSIHGIGPKTIEHIREATYGELSNA